MSNFNVDFSKIFPHTGEGLRRPSPDPTPLGTSALRASLGTFGPSIVVSPLTKILATRLPIYALYRSMRMDLIE